MCGKPIVPRAKRRRSRQSKTNRASHSVAVDGVSVSVVGPMRTHRIALPAIFGFDGVVPEIRGQVYSDAELGFNPNYAIR